MLLLRALPLCATLGAAAAPTDYFVSSSAGDDGAPGTRAAPWRSLRRVGAATLGPGDRVLLRAGDIWRETLWLRGEGQRDAPIRLLPDDAAGPRPVIAGNASHWPPPAAPQFCIRGQGLGFVEISGLMLSGATAGIGIVETPGVTVSDVVFHEIFNRSYVGQEAADGSACWQGWSWGITVGPLTESVLVRNCLFDGVDKTLSTWGSAGSVHFVNNTVTRAGGNAVSASDTADWLLSGNVFTKNSPQPLAVRRPGALE